MDGTVLAIFLLGTFIGALTSGLSGFAMGLVLSGIWLHIISPSQTAILIVACGLVTQGTAIWKLRHAFNWRSVAPYILGGAVGVPIGALLLSQVDAAQMRTVIGVLLVLYAAYSLARPALKPIQAGLAADLGVGVLNGVLGGLTGLTGIVVTIWCQLRGWPKDVQRAVFQPVNFATIVLSAVSLAFAGAVTVETVKLYLIGLPLLLAGLWIGLKLYGLLDDAAFRKVLLVLLLLSGVALSVPFAIGLASAAG
jgi:uncharacterized membrane protein YfcA